MVYGDNSERVLAVYLSTPKCEALRTETIKLMGDYEIHYYEKFSIIEEYFGVENLPN